MKNRKLLFSIVALALTLSSCGGGQRNEPSSSKDNSSSSQPSSEISSSESKSGDTSSSSEASSSEDISSDQSSSSSSSSSIEDLGPYDISSCYDGYYSSIVSWENGNDLKEQLYNVIHSGTYTAISYKTSAGANWTSNKLADRSLKDYNYVDGVYSADDIEASLTQKSWQREHAFPASLMTGSTTGNAVEFLGRATDFHNLFAGGSSGNMGRGNKNYGVADTSSASYINNKTMGGEDGYSSDNKNFEPGNKDKGRLARAIFYMATMYCKDEQDTKNNILMKGLNIVESYVDFDANNCQFAIGNLSTLLSWNNYAVDYLEMQHNVSVYSEIIHIHSDPANDAAQGNRNPFVDFPGLVDYVYGSKKDQPGRMENIRPSAVDLKLNSEEVDHYAIKEAKREYGYGETLTLDDVTVVEVKKNMSESIVPSSRLRHNYLNHTFSASDGESVVATIGVEGRDLQYTIKIVGSSSCSWDSGALDKTGLTANSASNVTYNEKSFSITVSGGSGVAISNVTGGGFKAGSGTANKDCSGITIVSAESLTVDAVYVKMRAGNKNSSFKLSVQVGGATVLSNINIPNTTDYEVYGGAFNSTTGVVTITITGSNALSFHSFAMNIVE